MDITTVARVCLEKVGGETYVSPYVPHTSTPESFRKTILLLSFISAPVDAEKLIN
jgi:hypothetical protein